MVRFIAGIATVKKLNHLPIEISRHLKYLINFRFYYVLGDEMESMLVDKDSYTS